MPTLPSSRSSIAAVDAVVAQMPHALWRAGQMAAPRSAVTRSGVAVLDCELPGGGWPHSALIELLLARPGIGEMQLLRPALAAIAQQRRIVLLQPPYVPQAAAWSAWGLPPERLLWIKTTRGADTLWSAEQILRNGSCGALLLWQAQVRPQALRRLHLAAQACDTTLWMLRPLAQAQDTSPAPLRLGLRPAPGGLRLTLVKRRGPPRDDDLFLPLAGLPAAPDIFLAFTPSTPSTIPDHAPMDRRAPAAITAGNLSPALV